MIGIGSLFRNAALFTGSEAWRIGHSGKTKKAHFVIPIDSLT